MKRWPGSPWTRTTQRHLPLGRERWSLPRRGRGCRHPAVWAGPSPKPADRCDGILHLSYYYDEEGQLLGEENGSAAYVVLLELDQGKLIGYQVSSTTIQPVKTSVGFLLSQDNPTSEDSRHGGGARGFPGSASSTRAACSTASGERTAAGAAEPCCI